jgi:membrane fusion protein (multidrug efflux system)
MVANKSIKEGQVVGGRYPLMTVQDISSGYAVIQVNQEHIARIGKGLRAEVSVDTYPDKKFEGEVEIISPVADYISRTFEVKIIIGNPDGLLKPGTFAQTKINLGLKEDVISVPQTAISRQRRLILCLCCGGQQGQTQASEVRRYYGT